MRELGGAKLGAANTHLAQHGDHLRLGGAARHGAMEKQHLGDLIAHPHGGIERGHRLLEYHADAIAANVLHLGLARSGEIDPFESDAPCCDLHGWRKKPHHGMRRHRLARAGFANQTDRPAAGHRERDAVHDRNQVAIRFERHRQILNPQQGIGVHSKTIRGK